MNESQAQDTSARRGRGRPRTYTDGTGHGAPVLTVRLAPDVYAAIRATGDPRAAIERMTRLLLPPPDGHDGDTRM